MSSADETWRRFGQTFQKKREAAAMTQEDVAKKADIHVKTISRIENGTPSKRNTVYVLANVVGWDPDDALELAGFARTTESSAEPYTIGERATVKLADGNLTDEERQEIADELALAYEVILRRREARKANN